MLLDELAAQKKGNYETVVSLRFREQRLLANKLRLFCAWQVTCSYQVKINLFSNGNGPRGKIVRKEEPIRTLVFS